MLSRRACLLLKLFIKQITLVKYSEDITANFSVTVHHDVVINRLIMKTEKYSDLSQSLRLKTFTHTIIRNDFSLYWHEIQLLQPFTAGAKEGFQVSQRQVYCSELNLVYK
jgi:hypothetical protein